MVGHVGLFLLAKTFLWPEKVCVGCVRQVSLFGWVVLAVVCLLLLLACGSVV